MARRKKKKKNFKFIIIGSITLLVLLTIFYITRPEYQLKQKGYDALTVSQIIEQDSKIVSSVLKVEYKDYILELISDNNYNSSKIKDYVTYYEDNNDIKIKDVINIVNDDKTEVENITKFAKDPYFIYERLNRYIDYYNSNKDNTTSEVIRIINTNTDYDFYTNIKSTDLSKGNLVIVNKYYKLESDYIPNDLVDVDPKYGSGKLYKDAYQHLIMMSDAAELEGLSFLAHSNYRSYNTQQGLYTNYVAANGQEAADSFSAKAGHSEHQTGLAMDLRAYNGGDITKFENSKEFKWVKEHAHLYGFILRYPEGKEALTGYSYEPWHYRYVGSDVAKYIYENNITYDEYYAYFIGR